MTMPTITRTVMTSGVRNKGNFVQGYIRGAWYSPGEITNSLMDGLRTELRDLLKAQNNTADVFVVFSYSTPIAWFSLKDSMSQGTNMWYFPTVRYSAQIDQHQHHMRFLLNDEYNVIKILPNGQIMEGDK